MCALNRVIERITTVRPLNQSTIEAIRDCIAENTCYDGEVLTVRSIAQRTGVPFQTIAYYLRKLLESGEIEADERYGYQFAIRRPKLNHSYRIIGLVGGISCGQLNIAEENVEEYLQLPEEYFVGGGEYFALTAEGESMIGAGIEDGDLVLIKKQSVARAGQIVVMLSTEFTDSGATLKRYYPEPDKGRIRLHPENDEMDDIYIKEGLIQGVAEKVIKVRSLK